MRYKIGAARRGGNKGKRVAYRRRPRLARTNFNKKRVTTNAKIYKALRNYGETKLRPLVNISPLDAEGSGLCENRVLGNHSEPGFYWAGCLSNRPAAWDPKIRELNGISIAQGNNHQQRDGDYVWLKKSHATFQVEMIPTQSANHGLIQFRLLVVKAREAVTPAGLVYTPQSSLFIQNSGTANGYLSVQSGTAPDDITPMNEFQIQNMPINKRNWVVFKDQRFTLSQPDTIQPDAPTGVNQLYFSSKYPCRKNFTINMNHFKKCKYQDTTGVNEDYPMNYDPKYLVIIFAQPVGNAVRPAGNWTVHMTGTTSFTDV
jgi:hypothetical protein